MSGARWRFLVHVPEAYNPSVVPGAQTETAWGRRWTLERDDGHRCVVEVEASAAALEAYRDGSLPQTARRAIQSEGRSAVERSLADASLPAHIAITKAGVRRAR